MADVTLQHMTNGQNISVANNNFDKIQDNINNHSLQSDSGNNVMYQDLDLNSHSLLNLKTNVSNPGSALSVADGDGRYYLQHNIPTPTQASDAVNKSYVDAFNLPTGYFLQPLSGSVQRTWTDKVGESISVKDFGAKGNGVFVSTGASIVTGSNVVSITGLTLTNADLGKVLAISGAGLGGTDLIGFIQSFTLNSVVISVTAALTVTNSSLVYGTDDTVAFTNALATNRFINIPAGIYLVSSTLNITGSSKGLAGQGRGLETGGSTILSLVQNSAALRVSGSRHLVKDLRVQFLSIQNVSSRNTIEIPSGSSLLQSVFQNLGCHNGYNNFSVSGANLDTISWYDIILSRWYYSAFYSGESGAATSAVGCVMNEIYAANQDYDNVTLMPSAYYPVSVINFSEMFIGKIAVEWMTLNKNACYYIENCNLVYIGTARTERITFTVNNTAFVTASGNCQVNLDAFMSDFCTITTANGVTTFFVGKTNGAATINFRQLAVRDTTVTGSTIQWANSGGTRTSSPYGGCFFNTYFFDTSFAPSGQTTSAFGPAQQSSIRSLKLYGSSTWTPVSFVNGASQTTTVTVTGAERGDKVTGSFQTGLTGILISFSITATNTVTVTLFNATGTTTVPNSGTLRVEVDKW